MFIVYIYVWMFSETKIQLLARKNSTFLKRSFGSRLNLILYDLRPYIISVILFQFISYTHNANMLSVLLH